MESHVRLRSGANAVHSRVDDVGIVLVRMVVKVILEKAQNLGNLGGQMLLVLPQQNTVECQMIEGDVGILVENLAFILVEDLPSLGLTVLFNVSLVRNQCMKEVYKTLPGSRIWPACNQSMSEARLSDDAGSGYRSPSPPSSSGRH